MILTNQILFYAMLMIVINFTPAKIVKVRSALKSVGGARTFVTSLRPYFQMAREDGSSRGNALQTAVRYATQDASPHTREALLDLFGLSAVIGSCAWIFED